MKNSVTPKTHQQIIKEFPISGKFENWYFRITESSANCFLVEGSDIYGRQISKHTHGDPDIALQECIEFARATAKEIQTEQDAAANP